MVIGAIGAGLMRAGAGIAGKSTARSTAGSILSTGGDKVLQNLVGLMNKNVEKILKKVKKIVGVLEKASPALRQQLIIIGKSISVFLRPIGDIMAKFIRPMAIWFLKIAVLWYKWLGGKTGLGGPSGDPEDFALQVAFNKSKDVDDDEAGGTGGFPGPVDFGGGGPKGGFTGAGVTGKFDPPDLGYFDEIAARIKQFFSGLFTDPIEQIKTTIKKLWADFIPSSFISIWEQMKELWDSLVDIAKELWDIFGPLVKVIGLVVLAIAGAALLGVLTLLNAALWLVNRGLDGLKIVLNLLKIAIEIVGGWLDKLWAWLDKLPSPIELVWTALKKLWEWVGKIPGPFQEFINVLIKVWDFIKSIRLPKWLGGKKDDDSGNAAGGLVPETGQYLLHAGERIQTAGQVAQGGGNREINITNHFNIPSTINSNFDIRKLAMKLADYSERELRRRIS